MFRTLGVFIYIYIRVYKCLGKYIEGKSRRMEMKKFWACFATILLVFVANVMMVPVEAQESSGPSSSSCLNQLAPCLNYLLNGNGDVPDRCCDPLKSLIKSRPECLCSLISNKGSREAERAGVNVTEVQELPGRCGQHVNPLACLSSSGSGQDANSAGLLLFPSYGTIIAVAICISVQFRMFR